MPSLTVLAGSLHLLAQQAPTDAPNPLVPKISELIVGLVAFVLLFLLLRARVFPLFEKAYAARTEAIEGGIARAEQAQAEADEARDQYRAQLADARQEAARIRTEAQTQRAEIVEQARVEARAEAERIVQQATAQVEVERQQVLTELRREVGALAVDLASRVVGESLQDDARRSGTVDRYLAELEQMGERPDRQPAGSH